MKPWRFVCFMIPALVLCACLTPSLSAEEASTSAAPSAVTDAAEGDEQPLFPEMNPADVTAVSIATPQSTFSLERDEARGVSINGQRGDKGVFTTLLSHINGICFSPAEPFSAQTAPLLTLVVRQQGHEFTAVFYADGGTGEYARVIASRGGEPTYGTTNGWHIGTLMLACEGMRIQDESGRETPMDAHSADAL